MKRESHRRRSFLLIVLLAFVGLSATTSDGADARGGSLSTDCFRSRATGDWATPNTWESSTNCTFSDAITSTLVPTSSAASVNIQTGHTVTISGPQTASSLTISGTLNAGSSTLAITGAWTNTGTFTAGTSTVVFAGTSDQLITGNVTQTFNNFTVNKSGGTLSVSAGVTTISLTGSMLLTAGMFDASGKIVQVAFHWTNNGGTYIGGVTFIGLVNNRLLNGSAPTQTFTGLDVSGGSLTGGGSLTTLNIGGGFALFATTFSAGTILNMSISGGIIGSAGTNFVAGNSTVTLNGTNQAFGGGNPFAFNNLTINNTSLFLNSNMSVNGVLHLENGVINIGQRSLTISETGSATRTNGYVRDQLSRRVTGAGTFLFPVGTANGYSPLTMNVTNLTTSPTLIIVLSNQTRAPNTGVPTDAINRRWDMTIADGITADLTFGYLAGDLPASNNESGYTVINTPLGCCGTVVKYPIDCSASPAAGTACVIPATHTARVVGVSPAGTWTVGNASAPTAAGVSVAGRVFGLEGRGATNASVTMIDPTGMRRTVITDRLGQFTFEDVPAGVTYTVTVTSRRFSYAARVVTTNDNVTSLDFTPTEP